MDADVNLSIADGESPEEKSIGPVPKILFHGKVNEEGHSKMVGSMRRSKAEAVGAVFQQQSDIVDEKGIVTRPRSLYQRFKNMTANLVGEGHRDDEPYDPGPDLKTKIQ